MPQNTKLRSRRQSRTYFFQDGDVTFISNDNVQYKLHRKYLALFAKNLPLEHSVPRSDGSTHLPDTSAVLDILFSFLYSAKATVPQDIWKGSGFNLTLGVSEAAERYQVPLAIAVFAYRLEDHLASHSVRILRHAARYEKWDLLDRAAPLALAAQMGTYISTCNVKWPSRSDEMHISVGCAYYERNWNSLLIQAIKSFPLPKETTGTETPESPYAGTVRQSLWYHKSLDIASSPNTSQTRWISILKALGCCDEPFREESLEACLSALGEPPLSSEVKEWKAKTLGLIHSTPKFSQCIRTYMDLREEGLEDEALVGSHTVNRLSSRLSFPDGDVKILCSDGVQLCLHQQIVNTMCPGLNALRGTAGCLTLVPETYSVMKLLFQSIYANTRPNYDKLPFGQLYNLARAAEKYKVQMVMAICKLLLERHIAHHPDKLLVYATTYGYSDIADSAAVKIIRADTDMVESLHLLSPASVSAWVHYTRAWRALQRKAIQAASEDVCRVDQWGRPTSSGSPLVQTLRTLGSSPSSLFRLNDVLQLWSVPSQSRSSQELQMRRYSMSVLDDLGTSTVPAAVQKWTKSIEAEVNSFPRFSSFL